MIASVWLFSEKCWIKPND